MPESTPNAERSWHVSVDVRSHEPAPPPQIARRLSPTRKQLIGLPLLVAIPIMTLFGLFGESRAELRASSRAVTMSIHYPTRFRYRQIQALDISVRNVSGQPIDSINVSFDTAYIARFSSVRIEPPPYAAYTVALTHVQPGETRLISAELWGERYGRHQGRITATARFDTATATVRSIVFP